MRKVKIALTVLLAGALLSGCAGKSTSSTFSPNQSSIFAARDGSITSATVEKYEADYYDQTELKAFAEDAVNTYNTNSGYDENSKNADGTSVKSPVALKACDLGGGTAKLVFDYASGKDLAAFSKEYEDTANMVADLEITTVADGLVQGKIIDGSFVKAADKTSISSSEIIKKSKLYLVTVEGAATIQTEGKVEFLSDGATLEDEYTVKTPEGKSYIVFK